jgi:hypothetical protein
MKPVSIRMPDHLVRAYDRADGSRSKVMRAILADAVESGEVSGVPDDLRTLAAVESIIDDGQLDKRRGTFRKRCATFFEDKWSDGYTTPDDAESMAGSWRREATLYGAEYVAWVDAVTGWYGERWEPVDDRRPEWPDAGTFHDLAEPGAVDIDGRLVDTLTDAKDAGLGRDEAVRRVSKFHADHDVEAAARRVWTGGFDAIDDDGVTADGSEHE